MSAAVRRWLPWLALVAVAAVTVAVLVARSAPDDSDAARAARLAREIKCPVCEGLSVADSPEAVSEAIRTDLRRRVDAGEADDEILAAYAARYGEEVLLRPEGGGLGLVVWGLPVLLLVAGGGALAVALRRWSREPRLEASAADEALVARARDGGP